MNHEDKAPPAIQGALDFPAANLVATDSTAFYEFERRIIDLDRELRQLSNAARQLGSSVGILSASFRLCERLSRVLFLFRENAVSLFPNKVFRKGRELQVDRYWNFKRQRRSRRRNRLLSVVSRISTSQDRPTAEHLPDELEALARDIGTLLDCFSQYPEFVDEVPEQSLEKDIEVWAVYLNSFIDDIETPAVRRYVHDVSIRIGTRLHQITTFIPSFIKVGIPTIRGAQKGSAANLLNLSTVAALFSGVTATMIQFSFENNNSALENAVNGFWFISLVFSISAAVNSLLGLTWMQAVFRSPDHRVPWWVLIWIKRSPLVLLVLSVTCFFLGLVLFAYASSQNRITSILTSVLAAMCCVGLAAMSIWFACERWIFDWHDGNKLLSDVLLEVARSIIQLRPVAWTLEQYRRTAVVNKRLAKKGNPAFRFFKRLFIRILYSEGSNIDQASTVGDAAASTYMTEAPFAGDIEAQSPVEGGFSTVSPVPAPNGKERFVLLVKRIIEMQRATRSMRTRRPTNGTIPRPTRRQFTGMSDLSVAVPSGTMTTLVPKLKTLDIVRNVDIHTGLVRDIQFSADGRYLATTGWDKRTMILEVDDNFAVKDTLSHTSGFVGQMEWSPSSRLLLTKSNHVIRLWKWDEAEKKMRPRPFVRKLPVEAIQWLPDSDAFLSVEQENAVKLDLTGNVLIRYTIDNMALSDVTVTHDAHWMLCVGTVVTDTKLSEEGSGINQIILYSLRTCTVEKRAPLFFAASDIDIATDDQSVLVSFEDKSPPQLWTLQLDEQSSPLLLRHSFISTTTDGAGFAALATVFGGDTQNLVMRAETTGVIHIWDRDSAYLLHLVRPASPVGHISSLAWNSSSTSALFATGYLDGAVRLWSFTTPNMSGEPSASLSPHPSPTPTHQQSAYSVPSYYRRRGSSFGLGPRSESPTIEDLNSSDVLEHLTSPRITRRATTLS